MYLPNYLYRWKIFALQDNHNTVVLRNYSRFDDCEFIDDIKLNKLLNGKCKAVKWSEWKNACLHISNVHAPIKTTRLKVWYSTCITRNVVKFIYGRDKVHRRAVKRRDAILMENHGKLMNNITGMLKKQEKEYFNEFSYSLRTSPRSLWSELNDIIPRSNIKSTPKGMGAVVSYINVPSFTVNIYLLSKGKRSIQRVDLLRLFMSLSDKTSMDVLGFDRKLIKIACQHIADSLLYIISSMIPSRKPDNYGPFYWHGLTSIPARVSNYMARKVWDENTHPFLNFNGCTVEV